ncbi:MAG: V-type ATP synthase subunit E [Firmicutes bacterium]|nr:V-type ATP synthase subunit E [Candidatus Fermentithermobacillaceae bacterium]
MGLSDIIRKIEEKSRQEADDILSSARRQAEEKIAAARSEGEALIKRKREDTLKMVASIEKTARGRGEMKARQVMQRTKAQIIDEVLDRCLRELQEMPAPDYRKFILELVASQARGDEELVLEEADKERLGEDFPEVVSEKVRERTGKTGLKVVFERTPLGGGFLLRSGGIELDSTFPAIMRSMRDSLELFLARFLFGVNEDGRV